MRRIDVIVMDRNMREHPASFGDRSADRLALKQVEFQRRRKHKEFRYALFRCARYRAGKLIQCGRSGRPVEARNCRRPCGMIRDEKNLAAHPNFPPILPCLAMVASTSTMARTAMRAVISEMS